MIALWQAALVGAGVIALVTYLNATTCDSQRACDRARIRKAHERLKFARDLQALVRANVQGSALGLSSAVLDLIDAAICDLGDENV